MATKTFPTVSEVEAMLKALKNFGLTLAISGQTLQLKQNNTIISSITLPSGSDIDLENVDTNILPDTDSSRNIGSNVKEFNYIFGRIFSVSGAIYYNNSSTKPFLNESTRSIGNYIVLAGGANVHLEIQLGQVYVNSAETINKSVTFPRTFTRSPRVILTPMINNTSDTRDVHTELTSVSTTGFNFSAALANTSYRITYMHWIAIGI